METLSSIEKQKRSEKEISVDSNQTINLIAWSAVEAFHSISISIHEDDDRLTDSNIFVRLASFVPFLIDEYDYYDGICSLLDDSSM